MVRSMFAGISGLRSHQSKLDVLGNNIANVNTWGYKSQSTNFMDSLYTNSSNSTGGNSTTAGGLGGVNASQIGYGTTVSSISRDFSKSTPYSTGNNLDVMIDGTGFLIVSLSSGTETSVGVDNIQNAQVGLKLSRVGILSVDNEGYLVDNNGYYVYGWTSDDPTGEVEFDTENQITRIQIPTSDDTGNMYQLSDFRITSDGVLVGYTTDTEQKITIGKIALADVQNVNGLQSDSGYYYEMGDNCGTCRAAGSNGILGEFLSGYLEMPNVDLAKEFAEMITTERGYQANTKIITVTDEMLQELVNMKR